MFLTTDRAALLVNFGRQNHAECYDFVKANRRDGEVAQSAVWQGQKTRKHPLTCFGQVSIFPPHL
jgi:hypothetical protein